MCIFANEGSPKSKRSRKETPLKIQKYKEIHVPGKNLEKKFSATNPNIYISKVTDRASIRNTLDLDLTKIIKSYDCGTTIVGGYHCNRVILGPSTSF